MEMKIARRAIVAETMAKLSESETLLDEALEYGGPELDIRQLIEDLLIHDACRTLDTASWEEIGEWLPLSGAVRRSGETSYFSLPSDFRRMVYLRMSDWPGPETRFATETSEALGLRRLWARRGTAGHRAYPGVGLIRSGNGFALEIYGTCQGSRVAEGGYLPHPADDGEGNLIFPPSLLDSLTDRLARHVEAIRRLTP